MKTEANCLRCGRELDGLYKGTNFCELCYEIVRDAVLEANKEAFPLDDDTEREELR